MNFDYSQTESRDFYKLLTGLIVPRPIALVTTLNEEGVVNAAPFSFFNCVGSNPPLVIFAPGEYSPHSYDNIRRRGEFVVNVVDETIAAPMNICATPFPEGESELEAAQLDTAPSVRIAVPRIAQAPAALECREHTTLQVGRNRLVIGEILHLYVRDDIVDMERFYIRNERLRAVGRLAGNDYCHTQDTFELKRLNYEEWLQTQEGAD
jgi:flavin reductase (DIM6/NTAB) family NADH-FMN oxidoreductase RutF